MLNHWLVYQCLSDTKFGDFGACHHGLCELPVRSNSQRVLSLRITLAEGEFGGTEAEVGGRNEENAPFVFEGDPDPPCSAAVPPPRVEFRELSVLPTDRPSFDFCI